MSPRQAERSDAAPPPEGILRPVVSGLRPRLAIEPGWPVDRKRVVGEPVVVQADVVVDGHDLVLAWLAWRRPGTERWGRTPMQPLGNDRFEGAVSFDELGRFELAVEAAVDVVGSWARALAAKRRAGQPWAQDAAVGASLLAEAAERARGADRRALSAAARQLAEAASAEDLDGIDLPALCALASRHPDQTRVVRSPAGTVWVDRPLGGASAWYELFPRSASPDPSRPGTLADVAALLPELAELGVDVLYLPPIHPIGRTNRKGRDGAPVAGPGDPGSPWAIGGPEGGHEAVHPELGTVEDVVELAKAARRLGMELALDLAFQCSPDHPWVRQHPEWFRHRPDGTIAYAENPPKRYEDVYPLDFESPAWPALWEALAEVVETWVARGVTVFRVDNPHTKPVRFWVWLIERVHRSHPEVLFLAEAFTRPRMMELLAQVGFSQSYTYFTWREQKWELEEYLRELTESELAEYFRPCFWPNTPDILPRHLQAGQRAAFVTRLVLAATASSCYGVYGPAFELMEHEPREPGSEEYRHSEKYEVRHWDRHRPDSLAPVLALLNRIRRRHPALRQQRFLQLQRVDNDQLLAFAKTAPVPPALDPEAPAPLSPWPTSAEPASGTGGRPAPWALERGPVGDVILTVLNLDPVFRQTGWVELDLDALGLPTEQPFVAHDLLTDQRFRWQGPRNFVALDPAEWPAHVLHLTPLSHDR
ncbi:alpha-1,4-glucan--maltose-1-phosphate maltosyltransferase [Aciditerrimonas ferrireducens]|uniref:alpha-1,4-glucan--maltose-1-phosphate maltosyltransferase n=1 Tax=Aciditerrimonas ferrireducens TaxID=667306 RepID=UPI002006B804|nr:alpha-1,4-glucan--maltose-1-phosphate maltosyltransferase [Aciditerrimonas ferrireducens]MCK4176831.1 alpha-1,4-glucan--maltose-1-phosphate maltosyltransferase [Aciditerrimonas ferrireducens]